MSTPLKEIDITLIGEGVKLEGNLRFDRSTRVHGELRGEIESIGGSVLIIGPTGLVDGVLRGDTITVDGFVRGRIEAKTRVVITSTGRVIGDVISPTISIDPGAYFEGSSSRPPTPPPAGTA